MRLISLIFRKIWPILYILVIASGFLYCMLIGKGSLPTTFYEFVHYTFGSHLLAIKNTVILSAISIAIGLMASATCD